jgi:DNA topoisomerase-1
VPSFTAFAVVGLLERYFGDLVDYGFTASMEDDLDEIAQGGARRRCPGSRASTSGRRRPARTRAAGNGNGRRPGGDGQRPPSRRRRWASRPAWRAPGRDRRPGDQLHPHRRGERRRADRGPGRPLRPLPPARRRPGLAARGHVPRRADRGAAEELLAAPSNDRVLGTDPETGLDVSVKAGRFGPYVQLGEAAEGGASRAPRRSSPPWTRPRSPSPRRSSSCRSRARWDGPRERRGGGGPQRKFGPYLKKGTDTRSLTSEDQILTVTLPEAQALFAQPKQRRGRTARAPLRELGDDPATSCPSWSRRAASALRDRRDDQRVAAQGRRRGVDHHRAGVRAPGRAPGRRPSTRKKPGPRRPGPRRRPRRRRPRSAGQEVGRRPRRRPRRPAPRRRRAKKARQAVPLEPF